jgi:hypothetical protein
LIGETNLSQKPSVNRPKQALIVNPAGITFTRVVITKQQHDNANRTGQDSRPESPESPILPTRQKIDPEKEGPYREYFET